jgi:two-component system, OmpR family, KDP operon response regulator KdpE
MGKKVLLIEDDSNLGDLVKIILQPVDIILFQAYSGVDGLRKAYEIHPDLIILDIMMPEMDGFEVCSRVREMTNVPILMLTARTSENDMLRAFNLGVDDFVKKPFNKNEMEARVRALLRRSNGKNAGELPKIHYTDHILEIDLFSKTVRVLGEIVELSPKEYDLLAYLVREQGRIVSHHELVREAWGEFQMNYDSITSLYICYLRKKLKDGQHGHEYIRTNWGRGYWFEARKDE